MHAIYFLVAEASPTQCEFHAGSSFSGTSSGAHTEQGPTQHVDEGAQSEQLCPRGAGSMTARACSSAPVALFGLGFLEEQMPSLNSGFLPRQGGQGSSWPQSCS